MKAALLYAGDDAAIDADDAAFFHGSKALQPDDFAVHVATSEASRARSRGFVRVRRSSALLPVVHTQLLRFVDAPTAFIAAARRRSSERAVLGILSDALQRRLVTFDELMRAHAQGSPRNAVLTDRALADLGRGTRSVSEVDFSRLAAASLVLPPLFYNCLLRLPSGRLISPDALAPGAALVLHNSPRRIAAQGRVVIAQFERVYLRDAGKGLPPGVEIVRIAA